MDSPESQPNQAATTDLVSRKTRLALWLIAAAMLLSVFAAYGQLALLLQWVEMRLC